MDTQAISNLRKELEQTEKAVEAIKTQIAFIESQCNHTWDVVYDPIIHSGRYTQQYAENLNFQRYLQEKHGDRWIPEHKEDRWKRTCSKCLKVEYTNRTKEEVSVNRTPSF